MPINSVRNNKQIWDYVFNKLPGSERERHLANLYGGYTAMALTQVVNQLDQLVRTSFFKENYAEHSDELPFTDGDVDVDKILDHINYEKVFPALSDFNVLVQWRNDKDFMSVLQSHARHEFLVYKRAHEAKYIYVAGFFDDTPDLYYYRSWNFFKDVTLELQDEEIKTAELSMENIVPQANAILLDSRVAPYMSAAVAAISKMGPDDDVAPVEPINWSVNIYISPRDHYVTPEIINHRVRNLARLMHLAKANVVYVILEEDGQVIQEVSDIIRVAFPIYFSALKDHVVSTEPPTAPPPLPENIQGGDIPF